jgi:hypothetical protein
MRIRLITSALTLLLTTTIVAAARAQDGSTPDLTNDGSAPVLTDEQRGEFTEWVKAETAWQEWIKKHGNIADRNWMGMTGRNWRGTGKDRPEPPIAPVWLDGYCGKLTGDERADNETCQTYDALRTYDWLNDRLTQQFAVKKAEKPEHSIFNFKRHWGFGLGYDNRMIHGSAGMQMTIAEWGRWNYGTLGASLGFMRTSKLDEKTQRPIANNDLSLFITLASASYRIKYVKSLGYYWYVDFAQIYDMTHSVVGSQFGFSLSKK